MFPVRRPTCEEYAASLAPAVRELPPGERPNDWANDASDASDANDANDANESSCPSESSVNGRGFEPDVLAVSAQSFLPAPARAEAPWVGLPPITAPQQYQVQFSTTEEHVQLIERAKALLARSAPGKSLGELHLDAMRLLVASLEKQKFALTERPRRRKSQLTSSKKGSAPAAFELGDVEESSAKDALEGKRESPNEPRKSRHIPAAVRRAVYERDGARCTYVDERGERCQETHYLELHHRRPFGMHGAHTTANLTLHCRAHNSLAAERDFGRVHMTERQQSNRHESLASELRLAMRTIDEPD